MSGLRLKDLRRARAIMAQRIAGHSEGGFFAAGLSGEGYAGGYRDALDDVELATRGVMPTRWEDWFRGSNTI